MKIKLQPNTMVEREGKLNLALARFNNCMDCRINTPAHNHTALLNEELHKALDAVVAIVEVNKQPLPLSAFVIPNKRKK